jgi:hypothetical protein
VLASQQDSGLDACGGFDDAANTVVQYYLALDRRQFEAAYLCLDPSLRGAMTVAQFRRGYATTVATRLLIADEQPHGIVRIDLHAVERQGSRYAVSTFRGQWQVSFENTLLHAAIRLVRRVVVPEIPATDAADVFAFDGQRVISGLHADVTGDGQADDLYLTSGQAGQQIWIFSQGRLVFAEPAPNVQKIVPGADHRSFALSVRAGSGLPASQYFVWTPIGFLGVVAPGGMVQPARAHVGEQVTLRATATGDLGAAGDGIVLVGMGYRYYDSIGQCADAWYPDVEVTVVRDRVITSAPVGTRLSRTFRVPKVAPSLYYLAIPFIECGGGYALAYLEVAG